MDSAIVDLLGDMTDEQLLQMAGGFNIGRNDLAQAWHGRYHDSMEFIRATFDVFDTNGDGFLNISEIQGIVDLALQTGDFKKKSIWTHLPLIHSGIV